MNFQNQQNSNIWVFFLNILRRKDQYFPDIIKDNKVLRLL